MIQWVYRHIQQSRPELSLPRWEDLSWEDQHRIQDMNRDELPIIRAQELLSSPTARDAWPMEMDDELLF